MSLPPAAPMGEDTPASSDPLFSMRIDAAQKSITASECKRAAADDIYVAIRVQARIHSAGIVDDEVLAIAVGERTAATVRPSRYSETDGRNCESQKSDERKSMATKVSFLSDAAKKHLYCPTSFFSFPDK